jgi:hypothetical protein
VFFINDNSTNFSFFSNCNDDGYKGPTSGIRKLTIALYTETGTNSIADKTGAEAFKFSRTWFIFIKGRIDSEFNATFNNEIATLKWTVFKN